MPSLSFAPALALVAGLLLPAVHAAEPAKSEMDAALFYQLLIGELELQRGELGTAYQVLLDAARRTGQEGLYRRAIEAALRGRAGNEAYAAARAWRTQSGSVAAQQHVLRLALALGRLPEAADPLLDWLQQLPDTAQRAGLLAAVPQLLRNISDRERPLNEMEPVLAAQRDDAEQPALRRQLAAATIAALARHAGNEALALNQLREASKELPQDTLPAWMALDLMKLAPDAEQLLQPQLASDAALQLGYARALARDHRTLQALQQFQLLRKQEPEQATHTLAIASLELELRHAPQALEAVDAFLARAGDRASAEQLASAQLIKSKAHVLQRQWTAALQALEAIPESQRGDEAIFQRASIEVRQGRLSQARERLRQLPAESSEQRKRRLLLEVQLLRDAKQWQPAIELLGQALEESPHDINLLYEHAMGAERLGQFELMEQQLRRVIELDPRHHHAHNALGYSLADRKLRLDEARQLIERAIELGGHEPFLIDSLGWVAFREGKFDEAERLLRQAHSARPDAEIAAHLAELLWLQGRKDEARDVASQAQSREPDNAVLRETRRRLGL
ncbi:MAG: tetratricopeptide repeat protein [Inhella sp.]